MTAKIYYASHRVAIICTNSLQFDNISHTVNITASILQYLNLSQYSKLLSAMIKNTLLMQGWMKYGAALKNLQ